MIAREAHPGKALAARGSRLGLTRTDKPPLEFDCCHSSNMNDPNP